ncbi:purine-binding chemotaxis protein CheW [Bacillus sp. ISL-35]|uniref:chemotaxis protein CheW n=1 Tax=Bacillus sp. ISL-35 TaxID=2819122 RepID=UPI001BE7ADDF|nr:chemotaxis protein CheW [Bacillus sp. ISL-35]MBT2677597.1 purine-binding chemotaxis protein CheW [Bacillus sp. ISL-35]MBT2702015.1 purine-binding chemotaxis protein CheW [Chryseobacterium sp. ISL-80]
MAESTKTVVFQAGNEEYAFPILFVISIEKMEGMTAIPHMPDYVTGITKVRGDLIPVIDLEKVLYNRDIKADDKTRLIVLETTDISLGVLVRDAKEILEIPQENLKQPGLIAYRNTKFITGIANFEKRMIMVIDPETLIQSLEGIKEIKDYMKIQKQELHS